jgi:hypothetical protein
MRHRSTNLALSHLKHLPVNKLKIVRRFRGIEKDSYEAAIAVVGRMEFEV